MGLLPHYTALPPAPALHMSNFFFILTKLLYTGEVGTATVLTAQDYPQLDYTFKIFSRKVGSVIKKQPSEFTHFYEKFTITLIKLILCSAHNASMSFTYICSSQLFAKTQSNASLLSRALTDSLNPRARPSLIIDNFKISCKAALMSIGPPISG